MQDIRNIVEEGYDKGDYTAAYRTNEFPNEMEKKFLDELIKLLPNDAKVLDLGCGTGVPFDTYLVSNGITLTGIDISQKHVDQAQKNVPTADFFKGDFSRHTFNDKYNAIVSFYAIFHIPRDEHKAMFEKMYELLKEHGIILITLSGYEFEYAKEDNWAGATMAWSSYSPETYRKMLKEIGFEILTEEFEGKDGDEEFHFWILARKQEV